MSILVTVAFAHLACRNLPDSAYRNPGGWKFPQAEVRAFLAAIVGLAVSALFGL